MYGWLGSMDLMLLDVIVVDCYIKNIQYTKIQYVCKKNDIILHIRSEETRNHLNKNNTTRYDFGYQDRLNKNIYTFQIIIKAKPIN